MATVTRSVLALPISRPQPARLDAGWWSRARGAAKLWLGELLARLGVPGPIRDVQVDDEFTGHTLAVRTGPLFVCISVDGRDFFFDRFTGKFDGTGFGCS